jgi:hypothetical protein
VLQQPVDHAGPVEPGHDREAARNGGWLEPADLLHPPDVQLQVQTARGQRVQGMFGAPGQVTAQVGPGVIAGRALEPGQVCSSCQPQLVSGGHRVNGWDGRQAGEVPHPQTLRLPPHAANPRNVPGAAYECLLKAS